MKKSYLVTAGVAVLVGLGVWELQSLKRPPEKVVSEQLLESGADGTPTRNLISMVQIAYPFNNGGEIASDFMTFDDEKYDTITSVSNYNVNASELILPSADKFYDLGLPIAKMSSGQTMLVVYQYAFHQDSVISWDFAGTQPTSDSWKNHPDRIKMAAGNKAIVTYASNDGGHSWVGSISTS